MTYTAADGRQQVLDALARATDELALALAWLGDAYEHLDEHTADRLEQELFQPVQMAYGRAQRTHADFSQRHGVAQRTFTPALAGTRSRDVRDEIDAAVAATAQADDTLGALQDSMLPVEVGDAQLRAALAEVRRLIGTLPARGRDIIRILGR